MRRYLTTIILLIVLLAVGGFAVARAVAGPPITRGPYVPTLSDDPAVAQTQALILVVGLAAIFLLTIGLGVFLAVSFVRFTRLLGAHASAGAPAEAAAARPSGPKAPAKGESLPIPLNDDRSAAIFWMVVVLVVIGFQVLRYWGEPLGYLPSIGDMVNMPLFRVPGTEIAITALHIFLGLLGAVLVSTLIAGLLLARGFARLDDTVRNADRLPKTPADRLIPAFEQRVSALRAPRQRRLPGNPIDAFLVGVNVLLFLTIAGIVAAFVIPSYSGVAAVDNAVQATRIAGTITATPASAGQEGEGLTQAEVMAEEFAALPAGNAAGGEGVYASAACVACHSLEPGVVLVGPSFAGLGANAGTRRPEYSAEAYLYEAITNPNAYVVDGFQAGIMPPNFKDILQPQQLADVIAFVMSQ